MFLKALNVLKTSAALLITSKAIRKTKQRALGSVFLMTKAVEVVFPLVCRTANAEEPQVQNRSCTACPLLGNPDLQGVVARDGSLGMDGWLLECPNAYTKTLAPLGCGVENRFQIFMVSSLNIEQARKRSIGITKQKIVFEGSSMC